MGDKIKVHIIQYSRFSTLRTEILSEDDLTQNQIDQLKKGEPVYIPCMNPKGGAWIIPSLGYAED